MSSALERRLIVVTGKGGVGKTTASAALGLLGARRGLRTIVVEVTNGEDGEAGTGRLAALLGHSQLPPHGVETELQEGLWGLAIDRNRVLAEWLRAIGGRVPARVLTSSSSFQYLIAAAPGAREMLTMVKLWELAQGRRPADRESRPGNQANQESRPGNRADRESSPGNRADRESSPGNQANQESRPGNQANRESRGESPSDRGSRVGNRSARERDYDLVVFDAPATGHALAMLRSPHTFGTIARMGPIARQAGQVRELLEDPARSAYLAVTQATEMGVTETLELREGLRRELDRELDAAIVNGTLPRRFDNGELRRIAALGNTAVVTGAAMRAAHAVHERAHSQQRQIARLRRGDRLHGAPSVLTVPFLFRSELDLEAVKHIADRLGRGL
jgi:anion-transporting  ArsA/GET3 family ATPase